MTQNEKNWLEKHQRYICEHDDNSHQITLSIGSLSNLIVELVEFQSSDKDNDRTQLTKKIAEVLSAIDRLIYIYNIDKDDIDVCKIFEVANWLNKSGIEVRIPY